MSTLLARYDAWHQKYGALAQALCFLLVTLCGVGVFFVNQQNTTQEKAFRAEQVQRTTDNAALLGCFNRYANAQSPALAKRSVASGKLNDAMVTALFSDEGMRGLLVAIGQKKSITPRQFFITLDLFNAAQTAAATYNQVKADNPLPSAPSTFCHLPKD
jgi:hypothetical protein